MIHICEISCSDNISRKIISGYDGNDVSDFDNYVIYEYICCIERWLESLGHFYGKLGLDEILGIDKITVANIEKTMNNPDQIENLRKRAQEKYHKIIFEKDYYKIFYAFYLKMFLKYFYNDLRDDDYQVNDIIRVFEDIKNIKKLGSPAREITKLNLGIQIEKHLYKEYIDDQKLEQIKNYIKIINEK